MSRILVIDDDDAVRQSTERMLRAAGFSVQTASTGEEGLDLAKDGAFDVILSDMRMPGLSGLEVLRMLRNREIDSAFLIMTGFGTVETAVEAMKLGAVDFVQKPFFRDELLARIRSAAEKRQLARQVHLLQRHVQPVGSLDALVGESTAMRNVKEVIRRAAAVPGTVLITGETGTGKELAARAIHAASPRAASPFVALNCAALTESLLENELFGHARGAFTGAGTPRAGLVEHATGGTLFLDEIGTMSNALQARLLRVIESGEVRRIGENELSVIQVCLAYVDAQREYYRQPRDASGVLKYAQKIRSTPGMKDGLYWDAVAGNITTTATDNKRAGKAAADAASTATTVRVILNCG